MMLISLTVGKVDAGVAVLLTEDNRLVRYPGPWLEHSLALECPLYQLLLRELPEPG